MQNNKQGASQAGGARGVANNKTSQQAVDALAEAMLKAVNTVVGKLEKRLQKIENGKIQNNIAIDSSRLGGKAPEYYLRPHDILDNSYFLNPVNQRGQSYYSSDSKVYTLDRWELTNAHTTQSNMGLNEDGSVYYIALSCNYGSFRQKIENYKQYKGKTLTVAMELSSSPTDDDMILLINTGITQEGRTLQQGLNIVSCFIPDGATQIMVAVQNNSPDTAAAFHPVWAALYEGIYTAETLPPYVPKGYGAELLECQRYYFPLDKGCLCFGSVNKWGSTFYGTIYTPVVMRTTPSINTTSNNYSLANNGTQVDLTSTLTVQRMTGNNVQIMMDVTNKGMGAAMVTKLWFTNEASSAYLSADL